MPLHPPSDPPGSIAPPRWILGAILGLVTLWRIWIAATTGLGDAEAYYWTWSRELAPGYLDHGPLVALLIRLGTSLLGDTPLGVRLPFVLLSTLTLALLAQTAARLARRELLLQRPDEKTASLGAMRAAGLGSMLALLVMPAFLIAGGAANPDGPFALLVLLVLRALLAHVEAPPGIHSPAADLALAGLLVGLACCAKLFGVLLLPLVLGAALLRHTGAAARLGLALTALAGFALGALPVLLWNHDHGWPTLAYHLVARHTQPVGFSLLNLGKLVGGQLAYASPLGCLALGAAAASLLAGLRARSPNRARARLLSATAAALVLPGFLLILLVPGAEPHWPMAGYLPLAVWLGVRLPHWQRTRRWARACARIAIGFTLLAVALLQLHVTTDLGVEALSGAGLYRGRYDLGNELRGWPEIGTEAARLVAGSKRDTLVAGAHYTTCAQLAFVARGRYRVVCPSPRRDQFDYLAGGDGSQVRGIDLLYVKDDRFPFDAAVLYRCEDGVSQSSIIEMQRARRVVRRFVLQRCHRFGGLALQHWPPAEPSPRR